jgi:ATP adenylyltransferase
VADKKPFNPFAEPSPALLITPVSIESQPTHNLVLNKFAIVPEHFILSTKELKPQTHLLEAEDLEVAHRCIWLYEDAGRELFVFFNSGEGSGASQEHRHLQLLDVENMREGLPADGGWDILAKRLEREEGVQQSLPFWTVGATLPPDPTGQTLREIYLGLYKQAALKVLGEGAKAVAEMDEDGEAMISYNLAMTRDTMVLVPRTAEGGSVSDEEGREVGWLALNGTVLAGTALVKSQAEWDALRRDPGQVKAVLGSIGVRN